MGIWIHIIAGAVALLSGLAALVLKKGSAPHKFAGRLFAMAMVVCSAMALIIALTKGLDFLFIIGVFSLYLTLAGFNVLRVHRSPSARIYGQCLSAAMALGVAALLVMGLDRVQGGQLTAGIILLVFAVLAGWLVWQDFALYRSNRYSVIALHIGRMVGAWIAAFSAFLVVNQTLRPPVLNWLLPTFVGVPLIVFWIRKTGRRMR